jgi:hypothetical protein
MARPGARREARPGAVWGSYALDFLPTFSITEYTPPYASDDKTEVTLPPEPVLCPKECNVALQQRASHWTLGQYFWGFSPMVSAMQVWQSLSYSVLASLGGTMVPED